MCGITGWMLRNGAAVDERLLWRMTRTLRHRGPDGEGIWHAPGIGLGHTRLAIRDLSDAGEQPCTTAAGDVAVTFNGEIYNDAELREALPAPLRATLTSHCDAQTLPRAFAAWGSECFARLRGMFAIALWDAREQALYLARDPLGIKPLYYLDYGDGVVFGSEPKTFLQEARWQQPLDCLRLHTFLAIGQCGPEHTWHRNVRQVAPGMVLRFDRHGIVETRYWSPRRVADRTDLASSVQQFVTLWRERVNQHLVSDVPVGVLQSGGIDSTLVSTALAGNACVTAFTARSGQSSYDESELARAVVHAAGLPGCEIAADADPDPVATFRRIVWHSDGQCADPGLYPYWHLSRAVAQRVKVALTGDGGDEFFGGYDTYAASSLVACMPQSVLRSPLWGVAEGAAYRLNGYTNSRLPLTDKLARFAGGIAASGKSAHVEWRRLVRPAMLADLYGPALQQYQQVDPLLEYKQMLADAAQGNTHALDAALLADQRYHLHNVLRKVDTMSMAFGLEIRVPLLDWAVVEFAGGCGLPLLRPGRSDSKKILRHAAAALGAPPAVVKAGKRGFVGPLPTLLREQLAGFAAQLFDSEVDALADVFNPAGLRTLWRAHRDGHANHAYALWPLLVFATARRGLAQP